jgi:hypothetical protein
MNTEELLAVLASHDLHPVLVGDDDARAVRPGLAMIGTLDYFMKSAKALGERVVFVSARRLQEADFLHEAEPDGDETEGDDFSPPQMISLATVCPELEGFKAYLNRECVFKLCVYFKQSALHFTEAEPWWLDFQAQREKAIAALEESAQARRERLEAERAREQQRHQAREAALVEKLRGLIKNRGFVELSSRSGPTQRGMQAAALEMVPVLRELSPEVFKTEIQGLSDRIKTQKALHKH